MDKCRRQGIAPSILSLAYEAGFNSKSTFNHYFKQIIGLTPSEYLKKGSLQSTKPLVKDTVFMEFAPPGTVG
jgi:AraC-like DNA-binding protein